MRCVNVVGGGLAGSEAAWQLGQYGVPVRFYEMRPGCPTAAHHTEQFAELVCSNSFRSAALQTAIGLLKEEMRRLSSLVMEAADHARVPAGQALAVDRKEFAQHVTDALIRHPLIEVHREEVENVPPGLTIIATGPLTSPKLTAQLRSLFGREHLYFYDSISPVVDVDTIDFDLVFRASRYNYGTDDYLNCPLSEEEYYALVSEILAADKVPLKDFEKASYFEGCLPIEEMARRGKDTLAFGPMKPVGLTDPRTGGRPYAVVQLRQDDKQGKLWGLVGFQTKMTYAEQRRIFRTIPGLRKAEFVRLGSLHRNTFIDSPRLLDETLRFRRQADLFFAGQIIGVEGYLESAAAGWLAGRNAGRAFSGEPSIMPPATTAMGSMIGYVTDPTRKKFQPMNVNYGLFPELKGRLRGREKKQALGQRALQDLGEWIGSGALAPVPKQNEACGSLGSDTI